MLQAPTMARQISSWKELVYTTMRHPVRISVYYIEASGKN
jgi:hypothetical protein